MDWEAHSDLQQELIDESGMPIVIEVLWSDGEDVAFKTGYEHDWY